MYESQVGLREYINVTCVRVVYIKELGGKAKVKSEGAKGHNFPLIRNNFFHFKF